MASPKGGGTRSPSNEWARAEARPRTPICLWGGRILGALGITARGKGPSARNKAAQRVWPHDLGADPSPLPPLRKTGLLVKHALLRKGAWKLFQPKDSCGGVPKMKGGRVRNSRGNGPE